MMHHTEVGSLDGSLLLIEITAVAIGAMLYHWFDFIMLLRNFSSKGDSTPDAWEITDMNLGSQVV